MHAYIILYPLSLCVIAEAVATLRVALIEAFAAVILVIEQVDAAAATARAAVLADLVAAAAVVVTGDRVHTLATTARRPRAPRREAHSGRFLGAVVRWQRRAVHCAVGNKKAASPGLEPS